MKPRHPDKHIHDALLFALGRGWSIKKSSGRAHAWGIIRCPYGHGECWMAIYSTPRNPLNHARHIRRTVERCPGPLRTEEKNGV